LADRGRQDAGNHSLILFSPAVINDCLGNRRGKHPASVLSEYSPLETIRGLGLTWSSLSENRLVKQKTKPILCCTLFCDINVVSICNLEFMKSEILAPPLLAVWAAFTSVNERHFSCATCTIRV